MARVQHGSPVAPWMQQTLRDGYNKLAAGDYRGASDCCRRLLGAKPDLVEAHFLVGLIALESNQPRMAVNGFGSVTRLDRTHGAAWAQLARLYVRLGHIRRADDALQKAIEAHDGNPVVADLIGTVYNQLGDQQQAKEWVTRAVEAEPQRVPFLVNLANNQMFHGELDAAERTLATALATRPGNENAHWLLSNIRKASDREHVRQMQALVASGKPGSRGLAYLNYGIGKELEDLEDWDAAFDAFAAAAAARRKTLQYNEQAEVAMFEALAETFSVDWLARQPAGDPADAPVFIVGQPRTGTTLVERIITSHSAVHSAGELRQFGTCVRRLVDYEGPGRDSAELVRAAANIDVARLGGAYMMTTEKFRGDLPRFVDKLPTNYRYLPLILAALPNARVIHVRRNPLDACFASFKQLFADAYPHSYELGEMARHHARYYHLMQTWRERFSDRFFEVAYEDVARDTEPNARALIDYLGLPWEDACLRFHEQAAAVTTASAVQVRQAAHTRSIGRWRRYESQLQPLRAELQAAGVPVDDDDG